MGQLALSKIIAIEKGVKSIAKKEFTRVHRDLAKPQLLVGISKSYQPAEEDGPKLPDDNQLIQLRVHDALKEVEKTLTRLFDVVATKDNGNTHATADIKLDDGTVLAANVPVPTLLFLEKQVEDLYTLIRDLPTLDPTQEWEWNDAQDCYMSKPIKTQRETKKKEVLVKYPATPEHPAQTESYDTTVVAGYWTTIKYSGALSTSRKKQLTERVNKLMQAVKFAREEANRTIVEDRKLGESILSWLFSS